MPIPTPQRPTRRALLRDVVFDRLRDAIVAGDLQPDEDIVESDVEAWANASRTPVREAIDRLAAVGLVVVLPQRGTRVAPIDIERTAESFSLLGELLVDLFVQVVPHLTSTQCAAVVRATNATRSACEFLARDGLSDALVAVIGNPRLRQIHDELAPYVLRTWTLRPDTAPAFDGFDRRAFSAAVETRDAHETELRLRDWLARADSFSTLETAR